MKRECCGALSPLPVIITVLFLCSAALLPGGSVGEEYRFFSDRGGSQDPQELLEAVILLDIRIDEAQREWAEETEAEQARFQAALGELSEELPLFWETDEEFSRRIDERRRELESDHKLRLQAIDGRWEYRTGVIQAFYRYYRETAFSRLLELAPPVQPELSDAEDVVYLRNERTWEFSLTGSNPYLPFSAAAAALVYDPQRDVLPDEILSGRDAFLQDAWRFEGEWDLQVLLETGTVRTRLLSVKAYNELSGTFYDLKLPSPPTAAAAYTVTDHLSVNVTHFIPDTEKAGAEAPEHGQLQGGLSWWVVHGVSAALSEADSLSRHIADRFGVEPLIIFQDGVFQLLSGPYSRFEDAAVPAEDDLYPGEILMEVPALKPAGVGQFLRSDR
jgi:hypothetical protein